MSLETTNYQCLSCNGPLHFVGESGMLECDYCGSKFTAEQIEAAYAKRQAQADERAAKHARKAEASTAAHAEDDGAGTTDTHGTGDTLTGAAGAVGAGAAGVAAGVAGAGGAAGVAGAGGAGAGGAGAGVGDTGSSAQSRSETSAQTAAEASGTAATAVHVEAPDADEDPIQTYLKRSAWNDEESAALTDYICSSCGVQLMADATTAATQCPYCGNPTILPGQLSSLLKPDYVIPFKLDKKAATDALTAYYEKKRFLPNEFKSQNHIEKIQGIYVPFWLYSATTQGDANFECTRTRAWRDSKNNYVETSYYNAHRLGTMSFTRVPVDGSTKMPDAHMDAIEPFDYSALTPFSVAYLPGYLTDRYDQDAGTCKKRASERLKSTTVDVLRDTVTGYESVSTQDSNVWIAWDNVAYALLPVWMLHTRWNDEDFLFAMNGQTGRLIGDLPVDKGKVVREFLLIFLPILIVSLLILWFVL